MTRDELEGIVPVHKIGGKPAFIELADVPNPFRTQCYHDHLCANSPGKWRIWVWNWKNLINARFSDDYKLRHSPGAVLITDAMISKY